MLGARDVDAAALQPRKLKSPDEPACHQRSVPSAAEKEATDSPAPEKLSAETGCSCPCRIRHLVAVRRS